MNWSFGIQQQVKNMAIDASYVGQRAYHLIAQKNINPIPIGARFNTAYQDPSQPGKPLADNFLRPYYGWGNINLRTAGYNSNYHSLQVSAQRRFSGGLQLGVAYTFSKALDVADGDTSAVSPYFSPRFRNYGRAGFDRPQRVRGQLRLRTAEIRQEDELQAGRGRSGQLGSFRHRRRSSAARPSTRVSAGPLRRINRLRRRRPRQHRGSLPDGGDAHVLPVVQHWNGVGAGNRCMGQSQCHHGQLRQLGGVNQCTEPGINNWDLSITKRFPLFHEGRFLQFRTEMFNAPNHTQYSGVSTGTSFNSATGAQTSPTYGQINGSRGGRTIALSMRISF